MPHDKAWCFDMTLDSRKLIRVAVMSIATCAMFKVIMGHDWRVNGWGVVDIVKVGME